MFNGKVIDLLLGLKGSNRNELAVSVWGEPESNASHRSVTYFMKRKNITTDKLEALSSFFDVPMEIFFLEDEHQVPQFLAQRAQDSNIGLLRQRITQLQGAITDKNKLIKSLEDQIALLKQLNKSH